MIKIIAFDADDTLWHNETIFQDAEKTVKNLLLKYHSPEWIDQRIEQVQIQNLPHFGYGIKGFILSMIETAVELSEGQLTGWEVQTIINLGKSMRHHPVHVFPGVQETIRDLSLQYPLMLLTKGDIFDQESKLARSGLGEYFQHVEIVSTKDDSVYNKIFSKHGILPQEFVMIGNSLRSDVLPVARIGGRAIHVPYEITWVHEQVSEEERTSCDFYEVSALREVINLVRQFE